jgi:hypothetical protein
MFMPLIPAWSAIGAAAGRGEATAFGAAAGATAGLGAADAAAGTSAGKTGAWIWPSEICETTATDFVALGAAGAEVALVPVIAEDFEGNGTPGLMTFTYDSEVGLVGAWICPSAIWEIIKAWNLPLAAFGAGASDGFWPTTVRRTVTVLVCVRVLRTVNVESGSNGPAAPAAPATPAAPAAPTDPAGPAAAAAAAPEAIAGFAARETDDTGSGATGTPVSGATIATDVAAADAAGAGDLELEANSLLAALKAEEREETWETLDSELMAEEMAAFAEMFMTAMANTPLYWTWHPAGGAAVGAIFSVTPTPTPLSVVVAAPAATSACRTSTDCSGAAGSANAAATTANNKTRRFIIDSGFRAKKLNEWIEGKREVDWESVSEWLSSRTDV